MIVRIPKHKKRLNESFFDDMFDEHDPEEISSDNDNSFFDDDLNMDDIAAQSVQDEVVTTYGKEYEENTVKPKVEKLMDYWDVENYDLTCTGKGVQIDVHNHLYLPNKKLYTFNDPEWFFGTVDGNVIFTNNKLSSWKLFPKIIKGDCIANFNNIKNFIGVPEIYGYIDAVKQNKKTDYPLTQENYNNRYNLNNIKENSVYIISKDMFGTLKNINESKSYCVVKDINGYLHKCKLDDINCLTSITNLIL